MATRDEVYSAIRAAHAAGDGASVQKLAAYLRTMPDAKPVEQEPTLGQQVKQGAANAVGGLVRGAGSIGSTLLWPIDKAQDLYYGDRNKSITDLVTGQKRAPESRNEQRRRMIDEGLTELIGSDPNSMVYKGGKLVSEIAGTAGAGGAVANALSKAPVIANSAPNLINAVRTSGMSAGTTTGLANLATRATGGALSGGVSAGMVNPDDAGVGALIGGGLPVLTKAAGAVGSKVGAALRGNPVSPEVAALAKRAEELGINIPADRIVDSKPLNALASTLNYVPFSGRAATEAKMGEQLNRAASRLVGQDSPNMTKALRDAGRDLGSKFDQVLKSTGVNFDQQMLNDVAGVYNTAQKELGSDALRPIASQIDELFTKGQSGVIDGQAAYNIKRTLDRIGRGNGPEAFHANELRKVLMDGLNRSLGEDGAKAFAVTRQQYGNMLALEKLAKNGAEGELSVARLANMRNINNQPLQELADIAAQFVKSREGQHGMAQRAVIGGLTFGAGGMGGLLGGATAGRAANSALNSQAVKGLLLNGQTPGLLSDPAIQLGYQVSPLLGGSR